MLTTLMDQNANSWLFKLLTWVGYILMILCILAYISAYYFRLTNIIYRHRLTNLGGFVLSIFGNSLFVMINTMEKGQNKAKPCQFDFTVSEEDITSIQQILTQSKLTIHDIQSVSFWELLRSNAQTTV